MRDQIGLLTAAVLFQALYLLIIPLGFECDAAMYLNYARSFIGAEGAGGSYYRAPGFPFFLVISGQLLLGSFIPTVAAHALMGVFSPLLFYRALAPVSRVAAFIAATAFILSTTPATVWSASSQPRPLVNVMSWFVFVHYLCQYGATSSSGKS